jgi:hypothetical protein
VAALLLQINRGSGGPTPESSGSTDAPYRSDECNGGKDVGCG